MTFTRQQVNLLDIPLEVWQGCIFEYWLGPIDRIIIPSTTRMNIADIMFFKQSIYPRLVDTINLVTIRTVHTLCNLVSKKFKLAFPTKVSNNGNHHDDNNGNEMRMNDFWRRVSNTFEMIIYWKRYESWKGVSLARGDISVQEAIPHVRLQKLIESVELNLNREYSDIINPSSCYASSSYFLSVDELKSIENEVNTQQMNEEFEKRMNKLLVSNAKFDQIERVKQLSAYDLYLHKALILTLDMVPHFDTELFDGYSVGYETFEKCCLTSTGLFKDSQSTTVASGSDIAIGLFIDTDYINNNDDYEARLLLLSNPKYIALSIHVNEWDYSRFIIPSHTQFLCLNIGAISYYEDSLFYSDFLSEQLDPLNVVDLVLRMDPPQDEYDYLKNSEIYEKNILSGITCARFPKLLRISLAGFSNCERFLDFEMLRQLVYVEILPISRLFEYERGPIPNWSERRIHKLMDRHFNSVGQQCNDEPSLIHHLITHANITILGGDADYDSISEYYDKSLQQEDGSDGGYVASISYSSINEYYNKCGE